MPLRTSALSTSVPPAGVEQRGGDAALGDPVVGVARAERVAGVVALVVAEQPHAAVPGADAVVPSWNLGVGRPSRHGRAGGAEGGDVEAGRERHLAGVLHQRAVAGLVHAPGGIAHASREGRVGAGGGHHLGADAEAGDQLRRRGAARSGASALGLLVVVG